MLPLSGCGNDYVDLITNFEGIVRVEANDKKYEFKIFHTPEGVSTVTFVEPKEINGLTFYWENGKYTVSMNNLSGEFTSEPLTDDSFVVRIIKVLNSLNDKESLKRSEGEEGEEIIKGKCDNMDYEVAVNKKGEIVRMTIPESDIVASFQCS
jgi:hypothetical protein